jgi:hypothetical protein
MPVQIPLPLRRRPLALAVKSVRSSRTHQTATPPLVVCEPSQRREKCQTARRRVDEADSSADAAQRQAAESIDEVNADIRELQDDVEQLERESR